MLQHEKRKTNIIIQNPSIRKPHTTLLNLIHGVQSIVIAKSTGRTDKQASQPASQPANKQASNLLAVLTQKSFGSSKTYLHQYYDMNLAPPQNLCREGYLNMTAFVLRATVMCVGGDSALEDRVSILFIVVGPPE